ncbi:AAA family ATPase [Actinophytocola sp.]|uniref:AAA family ATPase n=1 Tax=Actinophytocola sp. TaxID=1872138 RepID=UPI002D7F8D01|nr:AAA family ATPase [Actinophytocola sp.]HET9140420.1 AAA family ATPase [Actinophytocola sp.]
MLNARKFRHTLVLGKFYPPHAGHHHLIRTAAKVSDRTTVAVLASPVESVPLADRVYWLAAEHWSDPGVVVLGDIDDRPLDRYDRGAWELHLKVLRSVLARRAIREDDPAVAPVDAVFSNEPYGDELAARLGATHVPVDPQHRAVPVSGSSVRADPVGQWQHLAMPTRAGLAARVIVVGAESTGTTTLSEQLAAHYRNRGGSFRDTRSVAEYARVHCEEKLAAEHALAKASGRPPPTVDNLGWTVGDFLDVARRQAIAEDDAAARGGPLLVCDSDSWAATIWCERYLGRPYPEVEQLVGERRPALYLLTDHVGVACQPESWHDHTHRREWMTARFVRGLRDRGVPWVLLTGDPTHRLRRAVRACDDLLGTHFRFAEPLGG